MTKRLEAVAGAILFALIVVVGIKVGGDAINHLVTPAAPPAVEQAAALAPQQPQSQQQQPAAGAAGLEAPAPDPIAAMVASADVQAGEAAAKACKACHTFEDGGPSRVGPNLHGIVGRDIAAAQGFSYSDALKGVDGAWTDERLDGFLSNPKAAAPGTKMAFAGVKKAEDRAALIAYLRSLSPNAPPPE